MKERCAARVGRLEVVLILGAGLLLGGCSSIMAGMQNSYQAQRAYEAGLSKYKAKDYAGAIPKFQQALASDPRLDDAEAHLAWAYYHVGKFPEATKHFRTALVRQPQWPGLYDGLGWSRFRSERYYLALESFQQAVALDPGYRDAGVGLAYTLYALQRYEEALPHLERLTREGERNSLQSASSDLEQVRSRYAWTLFFLGEHAKARDQFTKGVAARPNWAGLHNGLAWTLLKTGDWQRAREHFQQALKIQPDFADAKEGLTQVEEAKM